MFPSQHMMLSHTYMVGIDFDQDIIHRKPIGHAMIPSSGTMPSLYERRVNNPITKQKGIKTQEKSDALGTKY
jgi:hypothetical protein